MPTRRPKLPAILWYTGDWMKDPAVRSVSYAARGLWFDMLNLMSESHPRGFLTLNGQPMTPAALARATGGEPHEVARLLTELELAGVFSTDRGIIYSRRMVRDENKRQLCAKAGRRGGGNPALRRQKDSPKSQETPCFVGGNTGSPTFKGTSKGTVKGSPKGALEDVNEIEDPRKERVPGKESADPPPDDSGGMPRSPLIDEVPDWVFSGIGPNLQCREFRNAWAEWVAHLQETDVEFTARSLRGQLEHLNKIGKPRALAAIAYSIRQNYKGIYEEKGGDGSTHPKLTAREQERKRFDEALDARYPSEKKP